MRQEKKTDRHERSKWEEEGEMIVHALGGRKEQNRDIAGRNNKCDKTQIYLQIHSYEMLSKQCRKVSMDDSVMKIKKAG